MTLDHQAFNVDAYRLILECLIMIRRGVASNGSLYQTLVLEVGNRCRPPNPNFVSSEKHMNIYSGSIPSRSHEACFVGLPEEERTLDDCCQTSVVTALSRRVQQQISEQCISFLAAR
jgi:hypothetical protein